VLYHCCQTGACLWRPTVKHFVENIEDSFALRCATTKYCNPDETERATGFYYSFPLVWQMRAVETQYRIKKHHCYAAILITYLTGLPDRVRLFWTEPPTVYVCTFSSFCRSSVLTRQYCQWPLAMVQQCRDFSSTMVILISYVATFRRWSYEFNLCFCYKNT